MNIFSRTFGHLKTIIKHKSYVFYYCCKMGIPWRGIVHDISKFSPTEFIESVQFYTGTGSPINEAKHVKGYSSAWNHHKGMNPHHYEHWVDNLDGGGTPLVMPYKYAVELICDYLAAARTYNKNFTFEDELMWWNSRKDSMAMNDKIKKFVTVCFETMVSENCILDKQTMKDIYNWVVYVQ